MRANRRTVLLASAAAVVPPMLTSTASSAYADEATPSASPVAGGYPQETLDVVASVLADADAGLLPGVVVYIDSPRGVIHEAAGLADIASATPIDPNAIFQIGSNTKMMTAAMVLQLQEEGLLSVDDTLATHLPDVAPRFLAGDTITLRMLLQHTSGLYDYVEDLAATGFTTYHLTGETSGFAQAWTPEQIVDYVATYRARNVSFFPGTEGAWHYSNTNYILLGLVIEKLTGKSYAENLQTRIFAPLGLQRTAIASGVWDGTTTGYYQAPFTLVTSGWNLSQAWSAGAVTSTPQELAAFLRALITGKLFTKPETLALMQTTVQGGLEYGLGLVHFGGVAWGHGGQTLGFLSKAIYVPETDTAIIAWTNTAVTESIAWQIIEPVAPGL